MTMTDDPNLDNKSCLKCPTMQQKADLFSSFEFVQENVLFEWERHNKKLLEL